MNYSYLIKSKFKGCEQISSMNDPYRNCEIKIFRLQGTVKEVGLFAEKYADAWVASVDMLSHHNPKLNLTELLKSTTIVRRPLPFISRRPINVRT